MGDEETGYSVPLLQDRAIPQAIAERLLRWTIPDLRYRARADASHYECLGLAAILRRTLLDSNAVINAARSRLALPQPTFEFSPYEPPMMPTRAPGEHGWTPVLGFADRTFTEPNQRGTLKQFLAAPVAHFRGEPIAVRRFVRYFAHVEGGVHLLRPEDDFERTIQQIVASVDAAGGMWAKALAHIAIVTARALDPIAEEIRSKPIPSLYFQERRNAPDVTSG